MIVAMTVTETILEVAEIAMLPRICAESPLLATVGALMPRKTHGSERAPMAMVVSSLGANPAAAAAAADVTSAAKMAIG